MAKDGKTKSKKSPGKKKPTVIAVKKTTTMPLPPSLGLILGAGGRPGMGPGGPVGGAMARRRRRRPMGY